MNQEKEDRVFSKIMGLFLFLMTFGLILTLWP